MPFFDYISIQLRIIFNLNRYKKLNWSVGQLIQNSGKNSNKLL